MPGVKRSSAQIEGERRALERLAAIGAEARTSRRRRHLTQLDVAARIGVSRAYVAKIEGGLARGVPMAVLFALAEALGRPFRVDFVRDQLDSPADAGHLAIQELVLRLARTAGYDGRFELATRPSDPARSSDITLIDHRHRRVVLVECWNTFGDVGAAVRSSERKLTEAVGLAALRGRDAGPFQIGACWVVRDTRANRSLMDRYPHIFESRFPGPSAAWVSVLTEGGPLPGVPGIVWCDLPATRLFARRRGRLPT